MRNKRLRSPRVGMCVLSLLRKTVWPSGLRRWLKAPFRKGVGSNPTAVILQAPTALKRRMAKIHLARIELAIFSV